MHHIHEADAADDDVEEGLGEVGQEWDPRNPWALDRTNLLLLLVVVVQRQINHNLVLCCHVDDLHAQVCSDLMAMA
eukprot:40805-Eustigmatos_ZCMA.PRE.1